MSVRSILVGLFCFLVAGAIVTTLRMGAADPTPKPVITPAATGEVRIPIVFWATPTEEEALRIVADAEGSSGVTTTYREDGYWQVQIQPVLNFLRARADHIERTNRISAVGEQIKALSKQEFGSLQSFLDTMRPRMSGSNGTATGNSPFLSSNSATNNPPSPPAQ